MGQETIRAFFGDAGIGFAVYERTRRVLAGLDDVTVRVSKSQVAFRRRRGFAYLWRPRRYLRGAQVDVVLSIALAREDRSARFKEVAHPAPRVWIHHLELRDVDEIDDEIEALLLEAASLAGA